MKLAVAFLAALGGAAFVMLFAQLPGEQSIRLAGFIGTAVVAAAISLLLRRRSARTQKAHEKQRH